jgi:hypothetical protein
MAEYRTIRMAFWNDPYIEELSASDKLLYLYLFTCPHTNNLGVLEISRRKMAFESGLTVESVNAGVDRLEADGKLVLDGNKIWLVNFIKNQTFTSDKIARGLQALWESTESEIIRQKAMKRYPTLFAVTDTASPHIDIPSKGIDTQSRGMDTPSKGIDTPCIPIAEKEEEKEREEEEEESNARGARGHTPISADEAEPMPPSPAKQEASSSAPPPDEKYLAFARRFQNEVILAHGNTAPKFTEQLVLSGAQVLDKAVRLDGFEWQEMQDALLWAITDDFWGQNVKSLAQIRNKTRAGITKLQSVVSEFRRRREQPNARDMPDPEKYGVWDPGWIASGLPLN